MESQALLGKTSVNNLALLNNASLSKTVIITPLTELVYDLRKMTNVKATSSLLGIE